MNLEEIRKNFKEFVGVEKYNQFILTLYESFPLREKLFFWQEQLLDSFSNEFKISVIDFEKAYKIFDHCPVHDFQLKKDMVLIVDGERLKPKDVSNNKDDFPMANINAPRNLERFKYPEKIEVFYCDLCRKARKNILE